jgi:type II secretion system protein N
MMRKVLWLLAGTAWGLVTFAGGLWFGFPEDAAKARLVHEVGARSDDDYALDVGGLSPWRLSGLDATEVKFYTVKKPRKGARKAKKKDAEDDAPVEPADAEAKPLERTLALSLDRLAIRAAILPLLKGEQAVAFVAEALDGTLDGTFAQSDSGMRIAFDAEDLDLTKIPQGDTDGRKLSFLGKVEGSADLTFDTTDTKKSTGSLRLDMPGFGLAKGSSVGGFELPEVVFEKAVLAFEAKDGKLEVTEGTFESNTLTATVSGNITLNKRLARSRMRLEIVFTLPEDLDQLAQLAPDLKRARDSEGQYHYLVTGTILDPSARPSRTGARLKGGLGREGGDDGGPGLLDRPNLGPGANADMSDEERKAAREERLRERRERMKKRREEAEKNGGVPMGPGKGMPQPRDLDEFDPDEPGPPPNAWDDGPNGPPPPPEGPPLDDGPPPPFPDGPEE